MAGDRNMYYQGDVVEVSFAGSLGHEAKRKRPAVVIGCNRFNAMSSLCVVVPVTTTDNRYPLHIRIEPGNVIEGFVCIEQLVSLDLRYRGYEVLGSLDENTMRNILDAIGAVFDI